ncbi:MAG: hypothetical protein HY351_04525, partial [Candidatus Omnitrophica bacterium]|nr:hypothetical protein [Candidatus Omnitrophota bacterium]
MTDLTALQEEVKSKLADIQDPQALEALRVSYLGRKGKVTNLFRELGSLSQAERPRFGQALNELKKFVETQIRQKGESFGVKVGQDDSSFDPTLPGVLPRLGRLH